MPGHVDRADSFSVSGWATTAEHKSSDIVEIFVDGASVATVLASRLRVDLRKRGIADGLCAFTHVFESPIALFLPTSVEVKSRSTGKTLGPGLITLPPLMSNGKDYNINIASTFYVVSLRSITTSELGSKVKAVVLAPPSAQLDVVVDPQELELLEQSVSLGNIGPWRINEILGKNLACWHVSFEVRHRRNPRSRYSPVSIVDKAQEASDLTAPQTIPLAVCIPCGPLWRELPSADHWSRVASSSMTADVFVAGGINSAYKISAIAKKFLAIKSGIKVVDWGVGCGRVAVPLKRIFLKKASIVGFDVDEFNIEWCKTHLSDIPTEACDYFPPLKLAARSVDLIYGVSVMTHLTEAAQEIWLREIKRILKPDGICILSVHGDYSLLINRGFSPIVFHQLKAFGISDISYNWDGLGPKLPLKGYYRGAFQLRQQVEEAWGRHFQILEYLPAANELNQDFVVLKVK